VLDGEMGNTPREDLLPIGDELSCFKGCYGISVQ